MEPLRLAGSRKVAIVSMFTALAVATDYAMFPLANIKVMDAIVFVCAVTFGLQVGASVGVLTWLVYGEVNPLGPDGGLLLLILMGSETVYALLGFLVRRSLGSDAYAPPARSLLWGSLGLMGAFLYDLVTNIVPPLVAGTSPVAAVLFLVPAFPFMVAHEASDFFFFATLAPILYGAIRRVAKREIEVVSVGPQVLDSKP